MPTSGMTGQVSSRWSLEGNPSAPCLSLHVTAWPSGVLKTTCFRDTMFLVICLISAYVGRLAGSQGRVSRGPTEQSAHGLAQARGSGTGRPVGGGGWPWGGRDGLPLPLPVSCLSVEQKLSGSHKALVEMQGVVAELLKTVPREYPATKVSGWAVGQLGS